ncbi:MAG: TetR/AcrR family transcriptional regulator [Rhizobiaceae bacterium]|nr:TetR/AcrR family transcriptional regulator [Rhizobiaceae bacterium]
MSDVATALLDAAERHIRVGGYGAFSFRDLASEVGVKSSTVHYHFPTKEKLAASVIDRYTARVSEYLDEMFKKEPDPIKVATEAFGAPVHSKDRLCPCVVMGAAIFDLPPEVSMKVQAYYKMWFDKLEANGVPRDKASVLVSTLVGGQLMAAVENRTDAYDAVAKEVLDGREAVAA